MSLLQRTPRINRSSRKSLTPPLYKRSMEVARQVQERKKNLQIDQDVAYRQWEMQNCTFKPKVKGEGQRSQEDLYQQLMSWKQIRDRKRVQGAQKNQSIEMEEVKAKPEIAPRTRKILEKRNLGDVVERLYGAKKKVHHVKSFSFQPQINAEFGKTRKQLMAKIQAVRKPKVMSQSLRSQTTPKSQGRIRFLDTSPVKLTNPSKSSSAIKTRKKASSEFEINYNIDIQRNYRINLSRGTVLDDIAPTTDIHYSPKFNFLLRTLSQKSSQQYMEPATKIDLIFSLSEEIDWAYHNLQQEDRDLCEMLEWLECSSREKRRKASSIILNSILQRRNESKEAFYNHAVQTARSLFQENALQVFISYLSLILHELNPGERHMLLEMELRTALNLVYLMLELCVEEDIQRELISLGVGVEEVILQVVRMSLDGVSVPIKKCGLLFFRYLSLSLREPLEKSTVKIQTSTLDSIKLERPRYKRPVENEVEGFYVSFRQRRMMTKENPLPSIIVVGFLKALLTTCPNSVNTGINIDQEWLSPLILLQDLDSPEDFPRRFPCSCISCDQVSHPDEIYRNNLILAMSVANIFRILLLRFKQNHKLQYAYLSQLFSDANGILVILNFLNQEFSCKRGVYNAIPAVGELNEQELVEFTVHSLLCVVHMAVKIQFQRIQSDLIEFKAPQILKQLYNRFSGNAQIQNRILKLLKIQIKYLPRKWKTYKANLKLISAIYLNLPPSREE